MSEAVQRTEFQKQEASTKHSLARKMVAVQYTNMRQARSILRHTVDYLNAQRKKGIPIEPKHLEYEHDSFVEFTEACNSLETMKRILYGWVIDDDPT
jgi:hypothetical protein